MTCTACNGTLAVPQAIQDEEFVKYEPCAPCVAALEREGKHGTQSQPDVGR